MSLRFATSAEQIFDRVSRKCAQFVASVGGKLGVECQNFDGESYLIEDALSRSVPAGKEFEVFVPVIRTDSVDVVDSFVFSQRATDTFFHDVTVFEHGYGAFSLFFSDVESHVSSAGRKRLRDSVGVCVKHRLGVKFVSAFFITNFSSRVDVVCAFSIRYGHWLAAVKASSSFFFKFFSGETLVDPSAVPATVQRIFAPLSSIRSEMAGFKAERFTAFQAGKFNTLNFSFGTTVFGEVDTIARLATKLVRFTAPARELFRAVSAGKYQGHVPLLLTHSWYHSAQDNATANFMIGAA